MCAIHGKCAHVPLSSMYIDQFIYVYMAATHSFLCKYFPSYASRGLSLLANVKQCFTYSLTTIFEGASSSRLSCVVCVKGSGDIWMTFHRPCSPYWAFPLMISGKPGALFLLFGVFPLVEWVAVLGVSALSQGFWQCCHFWKIFLDLKVSQLSPCYAIVPACIMFHFLLEKPIEMFLIHVFIKCTFN